MPIQKTEIDNAPYIAYADKPGMIYEGSGGGVFPVNVTLAENNSDLYPMKSAVEIQQAVLNGLLPVLYIPAIHIDQLADDEIYCYQFSSIQTDSNITYAYFSLLEAGEDPQYCYVTSTSSPVAWAE